MCSYIFAVSTSITNDFVKPLFYLYTFDSHETLSVCLSLPLIIRNDDGDKSRRIMGKLFSANMTFAQSTNLRKAWTNNLAKDNICIPAGHYAVSVETIHQKLKY
jgi:hypothetical protein